MAVLLNLFLNKQFHIGASLYIVCLNNYLNHFLDHKSFRYKIHESRSKSSMSDQTYCHSVYLHQDLWLQVNCKHHTYRHTPLLSLMLAGPWGKGERQHLYHGMQGLSVQMGWMCPSCVCWSEEGWNSWRGLGYRICRLAVVILTPYRSLGKLRLLGNPSNVVTWGVQWLCLLKLWGWKEWTC